MRAFIIGKSVRTSELFHGGGWKSFSPSQTVGGVENGVKTLLAALEQCERGLVRNVFGTIISQIGAR